MMDGAKLGDSIFKAYDVRGVYPGDIDETTAKALGCAFGKYIGRGKSICVSRDVRLSSAALKDKIIEGLSGSNPKIIDIGVAPTPMAYFAVVYYGLDGGINVTASHNPPEWNGFKFYGGGGIAIGSENGLENIKNEARKGEDCESGEVDIEDRSGGAMEDYENFLLEKINIGKKVRVGVDPGNGSYSKLARRVFEKAGAEVYTINDEPDGNFPARSPEPNEKSLGGLVDLVLEKRLDMGVAFDADGDRCIFVDGKGRVLRGDRAFSIFVMNLLKKGEKAVLDVSCTNAVIDGIESREGVPITVRVGRTFMLAAMSRENAAMGGEISGHMYFSEVYGGDDALFAGLKMAELVSTRGKSLAELVDELPHYENMVMELDANDDIKFKLVESIRNKLSKEHKVITVDGVKVVTDKGWFILRASNTTPKIRLIAEAKDKDSLENLVNYAKEEFEKARSMLSG